MHRGHASRLRDFEERARDNRFLLVHGANSAWQYIPIHPFADEYELLETIGTTSTKCTSVDAYWHAIDDVYFVQVTTADAEHEDGVYARRDPERHSVVLLAVVRDPMITRAVFEAAMSALHRTGLLNDNARQEALPGTLSPIG